MVRVADADVIEIHDDQDFEIEFDHDGMVRYSVFSSCCALPIIPCLLCWMRREAEAQSCTITDKHIQFKAGWLTKTSKNVPLDRVQDISIQETCVQRLFGIKTLGVQTAGSTGFLPEVNMVAPKNADMVRDLIMARRDKIALGDKCGRDRAGMEKRDVVRVSTTTASRIRTSSIADEEILVELRALRGSVARIETHIHEGLSMKKNEEEVVELG